MRVWWLARVQWAGIWLVGVMASFGAMTLDAFVTDDLRLGLPRLLGYGFGLVLLLNLVGWWFWGARRVPRPPSGLRSGEPGQVPTAEARRVAFGPALGLIVVGGFDGLCLMAAVLTVLLDEPPYRIPRFLPFMLSFLGLLGLTNLGRGVALLERPSPRLAWIASLLALQPFHPGFVLGVPVGDWTLLRVRSLEELAAPPASGSAWRKVPVPGPSAGAGESRGLGSG